MFAKVYALELERNGKSVLAILILDEDRFMFLNEVDGEIIQSHFKELFVSKDPDTPFNIQNLSWAIEFSLVHGLSHDDMYSWLTDDTPYKLHPYQSTEIDPDFVKDGETLIGEHVLKSNYIGIIASPDVWEEIDPFEEDEEPHEQDCMEVYDELFK